MKTKNQIQAFLTNKKIEKKIYFENYSPLQIFYQFEEITNKYIQITSEQIKQYEAKNNKTKNEKQKDYDSDEKYCLIDKLPAKDALKMLEESGSDDEELYSENEMLTSEKEEDD
ncbi:hypothetical protein BDAP_002218 [Binucleata daphniae]